MFKKGERSLLPLLIFGGTLGISGLLYALNYLKKSKSNLKATKSQYIKSRLTDEEQKSRNKTLSDLHYFIGLNLNKGDDYSGKVTIKCNVKSQLSELFLDWSGSEVLSVTYNKLHVNPNDVCKEGRIQIPIKYQLKGQNIFTIKFKNRYSKNGYGLHHFIDEKDKNEYLYTFLETFFAHNVYPCFDQPNLKAYFSLITCTPPEWSVISSKIESNIVKADGISNLKLPNEFHDIDFVPLEDRNKGIITIFPKTDLMCTYNFPIIAGAYKFISQDQPSKESNFPLLRIFCRKSLKEQVTKMSKYCFENIKYGIDFYSNFFDCKFPFDKYDQIFVPEFNMGAMENVGAVTLNERYIFGEAPTIHELMNFQIVSLHELSHMWFGNLVSLKWWNDMWLKESFAFFITYLALSRKGNEKESKLVLQNFILFKQWGFKMDQLPSTHPISLPIQNTEMAQNLFDGITFSKGANAIQQLIYVIGEKAFKLGLKKYFEEYQNKNADMAEFQECLQKGIEEDQNLKGLPILSHWIQQWIQTSGINIIEPKFQIIENKIVGFKIFQTKSMYGENILRDHYIDIAFINQDFTVTLFDTIKVEDKEETIITKINIEKPPFIILLNCMDKSFCKVRFDSNSLFNLKKNLHLIKDKVMRLICLRNLYEYVLDHLMGAPEYIKIAERIIENDSEIDLIQFALETSNICVLKYLNPARRLIMSESFFVKMKYRMNIEKSNREISILIGHNLIHFMNSIKHKLEVLHFLISNNNSNSLIPKGDRQTLVSKLVSDPAIGSEEKALIMKNEFEGPFEEEEEGKRRMLTCLCAMANLKEKDTYFQSFFNQENKESDYQLIAKMKGFWNDERLDELDPFVDKFFNLIKFVFESKEWIYCVRCFNFLVPPIYTETLLMKFKNFKETVPQEQFTLLKLINEHMDELERAIKAQNLSELYFSKLE